MIVHHCKQASEQWHELRRGKPTASVFGEILTPKTKKLSASAKPLTYRLLAERFIGLPDEKFGSAAMEKGRENEPKARAWYEMANAVDVEQVGICFTDDGRVGASPDGLVGTDGLIEIKCPEAQTHVRYMVAGAGAYEDYKAQIQGQLWVCERKWCDSVSWCPPFPVVVHRHWRDEEFIAELSCVIDQFLADLEAHEAQLVQRGAVYLTNETAIETRDKRDETLGQTDEEAEEFLKYLMERANQ